MLGSRSVSPHFILFEKGKWTCRHSLRIDWATLNKLDSVYFLDRGGNA